MATIEELEVRVMMATEAVNKAFNDPLETTHDPANVVRLQSFSVAIHNLAAEYFFASHVVVIHGARHKVTADDFLPHPPPKGVKDER